MNIKIISLETIDSTNEYLKRESHKPITVVTANHQTGGKGRRGRKWISPPGKGLYVSFLFEKPKNFSNVQIVSLSTAVAVAKTLNTLKKGFRIKWPNDILFNGKKVCGILPELSGNRIIVGIGVNLLHSREELKETEYPATSLKLEEVDFDRETLTLSLVESVVNYFDKTVKGTFETKEFESLSIVKPGSRIIVKKQDGIEKVTALGIDREGCLIVEKDGKVERLFSAEISVRF
ncbi:MULTISPECIES: biotin--[acetyl-CoA-carboxylase] ligase [unclassified Desulfurobacterium]|uniref:biotin--[acetyl-CoA-carboxylase] ligase n=1 Tax=unclassified Desulfurobacterium TaxID=2639089 RepID=UPI0003B677E0|nr:MULTISPECIES: biotin--[acetyl-CoA-carboxylase] ligase [unclassified Desulfurobacterium]